MPINNDGALINAFNAVSNNLLGFGSGGDSMNALSFNPNFRLDDDALTHIYRSSKLIQKIIDRYPKDATLCEPIIKQSGTIDTDAICSKWRTIEVNAIGNTYRGVNSAFEEAGLLARLYGNAYIIMGIDDGQDFSDPVDESSIQSIRWLAVRDKTLIKPLPSDRNIYQFQVSVENKLPNGESGLKIHKTRLLKFHGNRLRGYALRTAEHTYEDDSIIQALFEQFNSFLTGVRSGASMLASHSVFKYKLNGLSHLTKTEDSDLLRKRFLGIIKGLSSMKGLFFDAQQEDADFINRTYGGVDGLINSLRDCFVSVAEMPHSMLFGSPTGGAFSESGSSDRYEWAANVASYQKSEFLPNHLELLRLSCLAKDSPTKGIFPNDLSIDYPSILQLTAKEKAEIKKLYAEIDSIYIDKGVLSPIEVRQRFAGTEYSEEIELMNIEIEEPEEKEQIEVEEPEDDDMELNKADSVEIINNKVRINGQLLPLSEYGEDEPDEEISNNQE